MSVKGVERVERSTEVTRQAARLDRNEGVRGALVLLAGFVLLALIWQFRSPLALFIISITIAAALHPVVEPIARRLPRGIAVALTYIVLLLAAAGLLWVVLRPLVAQVNQLVSEAPELLDRAQTWLQQTQLPTSINLRQTLPDLAQQAGPVLLSVPFTFANVLLDLGLIIFTSVYMLIEAPSIRHFFLSFFPAGRRDHAEEVSGDMLHAMGGYVRGSVIDGVIVGALTYFGLLLIGMDYALVFGILAGLLELLPIIGPIIATVPVVIVGFLQSPLTGALALGLMILVQQLEGNLILPNIMHSQTPVSPLLAILALAAGGAVGGLIGAIIAIPIAAALHVFVTDVVAPAIRQRAGAT